MTIKYYGALFHADLYRMKCLTRTELLIYSTLIAHGGKDRLIKLPQGRIAELAGVSLGSCKRALKKFDRLKWIESRSYYQIKSYQISIADMDHSLDLDHSCDPGVDQAVDLSLDHLDDPHVTNSNKELTNSSCPSDRNWTLNSLLSSAITKEEILFVQLFGRWSKCSKSNWATPMNANPLTVYRQIRSRTQGMLNHSFELRIIDSWLLMHRADRTGKHWRSQSWIKRMESWFTVQVKQGSRSDIKRLSARQKGFFDYSITEMLIPDPPPAELNLEEYRQRKRAEEEAEAAEDLQSLDPALCTMETCREYIRYISNWGSFTTGRHWGNIIARAVIRLPVLQDDEIQHIAEHYPDIGGIHRSIIKGSFRNRDQVNWLSDKIAQDSTCGVDASIWRSEQHSNRSKQN